MARHRRRAFKATVFHYCYCSKCAMLHRWFDSKTHSCPICRNRVYMTYAMSSIDIRSLFNPIKFEDGDSRLLHYDVFGSAKCHVCHLSSLIPSQLLLVHQIFKEGL